MKWMAVILPVLFVSQVYAQTPDPNAAYAQGSLVANGTEYSLFDGKHRATLAAGGNYEFWSAEGTQPTPSFDKEFSFGGYASYKLVPLLSAVGSVCYLTDNNVMRTTLGANYGFYSGPFDLGVGVQYEFLNKPVVVPEKEWTVGLKGGYPLNKWLLAAGSCFYAVDSRMFRTAIGLRAIVLKAHE